MSSCLVVEVRCDGEQISQARYYDGPIPRKGEMVMSGKNGWFRVREIVTSMGRTSNDMHIVYLVCDRESIPNGLTKGGT